jgi:hypothetical protein
MDFCPFNDLQGQTKVTLLSEILAGGLSATEKLTAPLRPRFAQRPFAGFVPDFVARQPRRPASAGIGSALRVNGAAGLHECRIRASLLARVGLDLFHDHRSRQPSLSLPPPSASARRTPL